ncbi:MAG: ATP synthase F1 subunit epsilon [Fusobacteriaceae bacterium]
MSKFKLKVVTSHKILLDKEVDFIMLRTTEGDMGILANHSPFVSELCIGEMKVREDSVEESYFLSGGFLEVSSDNVVTILADEAMHTKDIDVERARKEAGKAEEKLKKIIEDKDIIMTQRALQEALTKVRLAEKRM